MTKLLKSLCVLAALAALGGCATTPQAAPEPVIRTIEVPMPQPVPCPALAALGPEPAYPDTDEALIKAGDIRTRVALMARGRLMRAHRLAQYVAVKASCSF